MRHHWTRASRARSVERREGRHVQRAAEASLGSLLGPRWAWYSPAEAQLVHEELAELDEGAVPDGDVPIRPRCLREIPTIPCEGGTKRAQALPLRRCEPAEIRNRAEAEQDNGRVPGRPVPRDDEALDVSAQRRRTPAAPGSWAFMK